MAAGTASIYLGQQTTSTQHQPPTLSIKEQSDQFYQFPYESAVEKHIDLVTYELPAESQQLSQVLHDPPTLTIVEQPAQFHRFRYESEVEKEGRVGGLLLGRSSNNGSKSYTKVRISGIDPAQHSQLQLIVCTVSAEDKAPHPYYLHGDNCSDGFFLLKKSVDRETFSPVWDVEFVRLAVICVPKKKKQDINKGVEARRRNVPALHDCPAEPTMEYTSSNLGRIRLAFSLSFTDTNGASWCLKTMFSDEISSDKANKTIDVQDMNPHDLPMEGGCLVAILTRTPTTGHAKKDVKVHFTATNTHTNEKFELRMDLFDMKKHLMLVKAPDMRRMTDNEQLKCTVRVHSQGFISEELHVVFVRPGNSNVNTAAGKGSPLKRKR